MSPLKRRYYDPFVQAAPPDEQVPTSVVEIPAVPGVLVEQSGIYFHASAVADALRAVAAQLPAESGDVLRALADSFAQATTEPEPERWTEIDVP